MPLNDVPLTGQSLNVTRVPIRNNFLTIEAAFIVDHVNYGVGGQGKHNSITFPGPIADPVIVAGEIAIYSKAVGAVNQLFLRKGVGAAYDWTEALNNAIGWTRLPSGILLKWGNVAPVPADAGLSTYTFPVAVTIPAFTAIYTISITTAYANIADGDSFVRLVNFGAPWTQFRVYGSQRTATVARAVSYQYLAIGV